MMNKSATSTQSKSGGLRYAPSLLDVYLSDYKDFLNAKRFVAMHSTADADNVYDTCSGFDLGTARGEFSFRWAHWG